MKREEHLKADIAAQKSLADISEERVKTLQIEVEAAEKQLLLQDSVGVVPVYGHEGGVGYSEGMEHVMTS